MDQTESPFSTALFGDPPLLTRDGSLQLPESPGLGCTINETFIEAHQVFHVAVVPSV